MNISNIDIARQKVHVISQIKAYRKPDVVMFLNWYCLYIKADTLLIIDDHSLIDLQKIIDEFIDTHANNNTKIQIIKAELFDSIQSKSIRQIRNLNLAVRYISPAKNDIVITPDNDEFWWYDSKYQSFKLTCDLALTVTKSACVSVPWILMSSNTVLESRRDDEDYSRFTYAATNTKRAESKFIMCFNGDLINCQHNGVTSASKDLLTNTQPNHVAHDATYTDLIKLPLRLYHYRFTTNEEFLNTRRAFNINGANDYMLTHAKKQTFMQHQKLMAGVEPQYTTEDLTVNTIYKSL